MTIAKIPQHFFISRPPVAICAGVALAFLANVSCDDGMILPIAEAGADSDADTDTDTDADVDVDADSDTDTGTGENEVQKPFCPINSGYPCACDYDEEMCDDGSDCLVLSGNDYGACLLRCDPNSPSIVCTDTKKWGIQSPPTPPGYCFLNATQPSRSPPDERSHCVVICGADGKKGDCPPRLDCKMHPDRMLKFRICLPDSNF